MQLNFRRVLAYGAVSLSIALSEAKWNWNHSEAMGLCIHSFLAPLPFREGGPLYSFPPSGGAFGCNGKVSDGGELKNAVQSAPLTKRLSEAPGLRPNRLSCLNSQAGSSGPPLLAVQEGARDGTMRCKRGNGQLVPASVNVI